MGRRAAYGDAYDYGDPSVVLGEFCADYLLEDGRSWTPRNWTRDAPGDRFRYSNVGMACGAEAVGAAVGRTPRDLIDDILAPLGMPHTAYFLDDLALEPAMPYDRVRGGVRPYGQYGYPTYPDGMLRSPAVDLAQYLAAMAGRGELNGVRVLQEASWEEMIAIDPSAGTDEDGQSLAWSNRAVAGRRLVGHNGGDAGSMADIWFDPETGDGFALATNGTTLLPSLPGLGYDLLDLVD